MGREFGSLSSGGSRWLSARKTLQLVLVKNVWIASSATAGAGKGDVHTRNLGDVLLKAKTTGHGSSVKNVELVCASYVKTRERYFCKV